MSGIRLANRCGACDLRGAMPLHPIPADPEPTKAELVGIVNELARTLPRERDPYPLARLKWKFDHRQMNPDAFLVPFATEAFPGDPRAYDNYRATKVWKGIRARVLAAANNKCASCPSRATEVHHRDYRRRVMEGYDDTPLVALCRSCHEKVDKLPSGKSRECWNDKELILAQMVQREDARLTKSTGDPRQHPVSS